MISELIVLDDLLRPIGKFLGWQVKITDTIPRNF